MKNLPVLLSVLSIILGSQEAEALYGKDCKQKLNEKLSITSYKYWKNSFQLRDKEQAQKDIVGFYTEKFSQEKTQVGFDIITRCDAELTDLQTLNAKSKTKALLGSSSETCISYLKEACMELFVQKFPTSARVVAIGDLHGDFEQTRRAFQLAGATNEKDEWIGKNLIVVQTGDQIDRWHEDRKILDWLAQLVEQAPKSASRLFVLNGNHEMMNVALKLDYVTLESFAEFSDFEESSKNFFMTGRMTKTKYVRNRATAFTPGQEYANLLAHRSTYAVVNDTVFVHGGIETKYAKDLYKLNQDIKSWMRGEIQFNEEWEAKDSPLLSRKFSGKNLSDGDCAELTAALAALGKKRMVVGHTPQEKINSQCDGKVWRIDVAMSRGMNEKEKPGKVEVLEIKGNVIRSIRESAPESIPEEPSPIPRRM